MAETEDPYAHLYDANEPEEIKQAIRENAANPHWQTDHGKYAMERGNEMIKQAIEDGCLTVASDDEESSSDDEDTVVKKASSELEDILKRSQRPLEPDFEMDFWQTPGGQESFARNLNQLSNIAHDAMDMDRLSNPLFSHKKNGHKPYTGGPTKKDIRNAKKKELRKKKKQEQKKKR